jgi:hypothetical protein
LAPIRRSCAFLIVALALFALPATARQGEPAPHTSISAFDDDKPLDSDDEYAGPETDIAAVDEAHAAYLENGALQLVRPELDVEITPPPPPPSWLRAIGAFLESLGPFFQVAFWLALALVVGGLLYFLFGEAIRLRFGGKPKHKDKSEDDHLVDLRPDAAAARSLLEEADALARQGRFAEAVHLLLFRSIEDIHERVDGGVPTSLTAREIAGLGKLPERAKRGLKPIILVVERSFFGGRAVDSAGWQEARSSYEDFAFGEGWA